MSILKKKVTILNLLHSSNERHPIIYKNIQLIKKIENYLFNYYNLIPNLNNNIINNIVIIFLDSINLLVINKCLLIFLKEISDKGHHIIIYYFTLLENLNKMEINILSYGNVVCTEFPHTQAIYENYINNTVMNPLFFPKEILEIKEKDNSNHIIKTTKIKICTFLYDLDTLNDFCNIVIKIDNIYDYLFIISTNITNIYIILEEYQILYNDFLIFNNDTPSYDLMIGCQFYLKLCLTNFNFCDIYFAQYQNIPVITTINKSNIDLVVNGFCLEKYGIKYCNQYKGIINSNDITKISTFISNLKKTDHYDTAKQTMNYILINNLISYLTNPVYFLERSKIILDNINTNIYNNIIIIDFNSDNNIIKKNKSIISNNSGLYNIKYYISDKKSFNQFIINIKHFTHCIIIQENYILSKNIPRFIEWCVQLLGQHKYLFNYDTQIFDIENSICFRKTDHFNIKKIDSNECTYNLDISRITDLNYNLNYFYKFKNSSIIEMKLPEYLYLNIYFKYKGLAIYLDKNGLGLIDDNICQWNITNEIISVFTNTNSNTVIEMTIPINDIHNLGKNFISDIGIVV